MKDCLAWNDVTDRRALDDALAARLRGLPQPLHLLEFVFRSQHYHFGVFAGPDDALAPAQERMSALALAGINGATSVLDIGCGLGGTSTLLAQAGATVSAIDPSVGSVQYARHVAHRHAVHFAVCTLDRFAAAAPARFEAAVAIEVLQHFPDLDAFFACCAGLLVSGGTLAVHDVCVEVEVEVDPERVPYHRRHLARERAEGNGFTLVAHTELTEQVEPTLGRLRNELAEARTAAIEFFTADGSRTARSVAAELDEVIGHVGEMQRAFTDHHIGYETMLFCRR